MICVIQRVASSSVDINGVRHSSINNGLNVLVGIEKDDSLEEIKWTVNKILNLRIFSNEEGKFDLSIKDIGGEILIISQFTLCANITKGRRPDFSNAMDAAKAKEMFEVFVETVKKNYDPLKVKTGVFQTEMRVNIINDGPVTIILDTKHLKKYGKPS
jgi:D-tyrosyl-tRNA(Tyr) deacylase